MAGHPNCCWVLSYVLPDYGLWGVKVEDGYSYPESYQEIVSDTTIDELDEDDAVSLAGNDG